MPRRVALTHASPAPRHVAPLQLKALAELDSKMRADEDGGSGATTGDLLGGLSGASGTAVSPDRFQGDASASLRAMEADLDADLGV